MSHHVVSPAAREIVAKTGEHSRRHRSFGSAGAESRFAGAAHAARLQSAHVAGNDRIEHHPLPDLDASCTSEPSSTISATSSCPGVKRKRRERRQRRTRCDWSASRYRCRRCRSCALSAGRSPARATELARARSRSIPESCPTRASLPGSLSAARTARKLGIENLYWRALLIAQFLFSQNALRGEPPRSASIPVESDRIPA